MKRWIGVASFALLLFFFAAPWRLLFGQGGPGFTKIGTTTTTSFTTAAFVGPTTVQFEVTGTNSAGESGPSPIATAVIPAGSHTVTVSWTGVAVDTGYNVYDFLVPAPVAPTAPQVVVN